jgi:hypothetical protein
MSTPSYAAFVRRHQEARKDLHAEAEQIADAAPDWMDMMARGLSDAVAAPLRLNHPSQLELGPEQPV